MFLVYFKGSKIQDAQLTLCIHSHLNCYCLLLPYSLVAWPMGKQRDRSLEMNTNSPLCFSVLSVKNKKKKPENPEKSPQNYSKPVARPLFPVTFSLVFPAINTQRQLFKDSVFPF